MGKFTNYSFYRKVLKYFIMVLIVPMSTIMIMCFSTEISVKKQIHLSGQMMLEQVSGVLDVVLLETQSTVFNAVLDDECRGYAMKSVYDKESLGYQAYKMRDTLSKLRTEQYKDIFVYYPYANKVVSSRYATTTPEYYFNVYIDKENGVNREQFESILNCSNERPKLFAMKDDENNVLVCMAALRQHRDDRQRYVAVAVLEPDYLNELISINDFSFEKGAFLILGEDRELIYAPETIHVELEEEIEGYCYFEKEQSGKSYVIQAEPSDKVSAYYAHIIEEGYYWEKLKKNRFLCLAGFIGCAIVSLAVAYRLCGRTYKPVEQLLVTLKKYGKDGYDKQRYSEFEYVEELFGHENEKISGLERENLAGKEAMQKRFVMRLLAGNVPERGKEEFYKKHEITLYTEQFCIAVIDVEPAALGAEVQSLLETVFCGLCNLKHQSYIVMLQNRSSVLLINLRSQLLNNAEIKDLLYLGKKYMNERQGVMVTIGVSRIIQGVSQIPAAFEEARKALSYKYIYGADCIIDYLQIKEKKNLYKTESSGLYLLFSNYISKGTEEADVFVKNLMLRCGIDENAAIENVEDFVKDIINVVDELMMSREYLIGDAKERIDRFKKEPTLEKFQAALKEVVSLLREKEKLHLKEEDLFFDVRRYISTKYTDSEFSLEAVGKHFGITPSYLSKLFKAQSGISVPDYILTVRLNAAKTLLEHSEKSIVEITNICGFHSSNSFIRAFKRCEGITPGVFREEKMKEKNKN